MIQALSRFGYGELHEVSIDRQTYPAAYWLIVLTLIGFAVLLALFIWAVAFRAVS